MHRQIAGKLTSPVTKWIVLVVILLLTGVLGFLGGKLADVNTIAPTSLIADAGFPFIEHEPHTPSRQERRKLRLGSISFSFIRASVMRSSLPW